MMQRRNFLRAGAAATLLAPQSVLGSNDRIRVALIGAGGRGRNVTSQVQDAPGAEVVAVSDVYVPRREQAAQQFGPQAKAVKDYREILDRKDIDAVVIATPDHWHAPMTIEAVSAGKDVYVEKPVTHDLSEGAKLIESVEQSGRVVATGTQQRSWNHFLKAKEVIDEGRLGQVTFVRCFWYQNYSMFRAAMEKADPVDLGQLDWTSWLGAAPKQPFDPVKFRFWRFFWDFGGGIFTDLMTHWIDVIQWFMQSPRLQTVQAMGATHVHDWLEAPDTVTTSMEFPNNYTMLFHGAMTFGLEGGGIEFRGDQAMMKLTRLGFAVYPEGVKPFEATGLPEPTFAMGPAGDGSISQRVDGDGTKNNAANWLECIRTRKTPNAHIRAGVEAAETSHWANRAMRERKIMTL